MDDGGTLRRVVAVGTGTGSSTKEAAEKLGGTTVARLQSSGEKRAVIDVSSLGFDADAAARVGLAAALRAWRYDRYRTTLKDKQKPTLDEVIIVGGREGAAKRYSDRWAPVYEGVSLTRELVTEPRQHHLPRELRRTRPCARSRAAASRSRCSTVPRWKSWAWARFSASPRARRARAGCSSSSGTAAAKAQARRIRRQGRDLRYRRHLDQAGRRAWRT